MGSSHSKRHNFIEMIDHPDTNINTNNKNKNKNTFKKNIYEMKEIKSTQNKNTQKNNPIYLLEKMLEDIDSNGKSYNILSKEEWKNIYDLWNNRDEKISIETILNSLLNINQLERIRSKNNEIANLELKHMANIFKNFHIFSAPIDEIKIMMQNIPYIANSMDNVIKRDNVTYRTLKLYQIWINNKYLRPLLNIPKCDIKLYTSREEIHNIIKMFLSEIQIENDQYKEYIKEYNLNIKNIHQKYENNLKKYIKLNNKLFEKFDVFSSSDSEIKTILNIIPLNNSVNAFEWGSHLHLSYLMKLVNEKNKNFYSFDSKQKINSMIKAYLDKKID